MYILLRSRLLKSRFEHVPNSSSHQFKGIRIGNPLEGCNQFIDGLVAPLRLSIRAFFNNDPEFFVNLIKVEVTWILTCNEHKKHDPQRINITAGIGLLNICLLLWRHITSRSPLMARDG